MAISCFKMASGAAVAALAHDPQRNAVAPHNDGQNEEADQHGNGKMSAHGGNQLDAQEYLKECQRQQRKPGARDVGNLLSGLNVVAFFFEAGRNQDAFGTAERDRVAHVHRCRLEDFASIDLRTALGAKIVEHPVAVLVAHQGGMVP